MPCKKPQQAPGNSATSTATVKQITHRCDVYKIYDCKVLDWISHVGKRLVHLHADGVRIVAKAHNDYSILLLQHIRYLTCSFASADGRLTLSLSATMSQEGGAMLRSEHTPARCLESPDEPIPP